MKYGIICAMEEEIKELRAQLTHSTEKTLGGIAFMQASSTDMMLFLVRSGIGKVQAGVTTALLIVEFGVDHLINSGSAGGIGEGLHVGDVVFFNWSDLS